MRSLLVVLATALVPALSEAQVKYQASAATVEVFGLRRWTLRMLRDSVRHYRPGLELHDAACMAFLKDSLGFADALVATYSGYGASPTRDHLIIKLVEPQDRARVQWDSRRREQYWGIRPTYAPLLAGVTDSNGFVNTNRLVFWLQASDSSRREQLLNQVPPDRRADGEGVYAFLAARKDEADRVLALRVLDRDGYVLNRFAAVAVLSNFVDQDSTWYALVRALRDPDERVRIAANMVMAKPPGRSIDWSPVVQDLRLLLGGTNIGAIDDVMNTLTATRVDQRLAGPLLRGNAQLVLDHLGSEIFRGHAQRLLTQLSGATYATKAEWRAWAAKL